MIIYDKKDGWEFLSEETGKRYTLYEMVCYRGNATSDIIAIWDHDNDCIVNHVYGANSVRIEELSETISDYVMEYETRVRGKAMEETEVYYRLSKAGVKAWSSDVVDDILERDILCDYVISHGSRSVKLPDLAEIHNMLECFLEDAVAEVEENG